MRKSLFVSVLMLLLPMLTYALTKKDLYGTWMSEPRPWGEKNPFKYSIVDIYKFDQNGKIIDMGVLLMKGPENGVTVEAKIRTKTPCTYVLENDKIVLSYKSSDATMKCEEKDIEVKGNISEQQKKETRASMLQIIDNGLIPSIMAQQVDRDIIWTNVKVTPSTLSFEEDGNEISNYSAPPRIFPL